MPAKARQVWELYTKLYFAKAGRACATALEEGGNSRRELVYLLGFKGLIAAAQGRTGAGVAAFKRMLAVDPRAKLMQGQSPRIVRAFKQAQAWIAAHDPIAVASSAPSSALRGSRAAVDVKVVSDPFRMAFSATLYARPAGAKAFRALKTRPVASARWELDLTSADLQAPAVEYHVLVTDRRDNVVAFVGRPAAPRRIEVTGAAAAGAGGAAAGHTPWYKSWPVWTVVGVTAVALVVGVTVGVSAASDRADVPITIGVRP